MATIPDLIYSYFEKDFKRKLVPFVLTPLILSAIYLVDFYVLPDTQKTETITQIYQITVPKSVSGTSVRTSKRMGYKYSTNSNFKFSKPGKNIGFTEVQISYSPIFNTVKSVIFNNKNLAISSGFNGINKVLMLAYIFTAIITIIYVLAVNKISYNAKLNLVFINVLTLAIWFYILMKFG